MENHPFDLALRLSPLASGGYAGATTAAYWNMVGPFGGVTAATALNAVLQHPALMGQPISLTVNYAGPLAAGAFKVTATPRRTNRSTQHWVIELTQEDKDGVDEAMLTGTAVTGTRRPTWSGDDGALPSVPRPDDFSESSPISAVEWINRYDMRFIEGKFPTHWDGSGKTSLSQLWMRDRPPRPLDTVSMTVYFHADGAQLTQSGTGFLLGQARAQAFRNGFF